MLSTDTSAVAMGAFEANCSAHAASYDIGAAYWYPTRTYEGTVFLATQKFAAANALAQAPRDEEMGLETLPAGNAAEYTA